MTPNIPGYRISRKIGEGGTSTVYSAIQENPNRRVALKIMDPELLSDPANLQRFSKQVKIGQKLNHDHIVKTYCIERHGPYHYIVMELLGESLKDRLSRRGKLNADEALAIVRSIAEALAYAHSQGVVHWDIKPGNILFRSSDHPVIVDFGLAFCRDLKVSLTPQGVFTGSLHYMSPEHCMGKKGESTGDIFSLGIVLFELLTGQPPYKPVDILDLANMHSQPAFKRLPPQLKRYQPIIDKMMAFDKKKRIQDGKKVIHMIDRLNGRQGSTGLTFWEKLYDLRIGGIPALVALSATALIIVLGLMIFSAMGDIDTNGVTKVGPEQIDKKSTPGTTRTTITPNKIFDPTAKRDITATGIKTSTEISQVERKTSEPENPEPNANPTTEKPTTNQTSPTKQIPANNAAQGSTATTPTVQSSSPKSIEISTVPIVPLSRLDPEIRANIEAKLKKITIDAGGITGITKKGNAQAVLALDFSGAVKSIDILGIEIEPKEKMAEFKSNLVQRISSMNFPSPTINGKPVNVKIEINFSKVSKFSGSIIWEI